MTEKEEHQIRIICSFADSGVENKIRQCKFELENMKQEWKDEYEIFIRANYQDKKPETVRVHPTEAYRRR